jgi:hypothetical protein
LSKNQGLSGDELENEAKKILLEEGLITVE